MSPTWDQCVGKASPYLQELLSSLAQSRQHHPQQTSGIAGRHSGQDQVRLTLLGPKELQEKFSIWAEAQLQQEEAELPVENPPW